MKEIQAVPRREGMQHTPDLPTAAAEEDLQPLEESDEEEEGEDEEEGEEEFSQVELSTAELDKLQGLVSCSLESSCTDDFFTC